MAQQDIANIQYALKEALLPALINTTEQSHFLYSIVEKNAKDIDPLAGRGFVGYLHVIETTTMGQGWRGEGGTLPTPLRMGFDRMYVPMAYLYGSIQLYGQAITLGKGQHALVDIVKLEMQNIADGLKKTLARTIVGAGTGALCRVYSAATTTVTAFTNTLSPGVFLMENGMVVDSYDALATGGTQGLDSLTVSAVDRGAGTFVISSSASGGVDNDYIYLEDSYGYSGMGLLGIVDDGGTFQATFQSKTRSTDTWLKALVLVHPDGAGTVRDLTLDVMQQAIDACEDNLASPGMDSPTICYGNKLLRRRYLDLLYPDRRYGPTQKVFDPGWTGLEFTGGTSSVTWMADNWVPGGRLLLFNPRDLVWFEGAKPFWLNSRFGGPPLVFDLANAKDRYRGDLGWYINLGAKQCRRMCRVDDLPYS